MPNAYASKICAGKIKDPSGVKRKDFRGPKPAAKGAMMKAKKGKAVMILIGVGKKKKVQKKMGGGMTAGSQSAMGRLQKARMMNKGGGADTGKAGERTSKREVARDKMKRVLRGDLEGSIAPYKTKKKMGGGLAAATERLRAQGKMGGGMMKRYNKGGETKAISQSEMQVRSGREKARKVKKKLKNIGNQVKGFGKEMLGFEKGGMADYYKDLM